MRDYYSEDDHYYEAEMLREYGYGAMRVYDDCSCDERYTCRKCLQKM